MKLLPVRCRWIGAIALAASALLSAAPPAEMNDATAGTAVKGLTTTQSNSLDREIAARMLQRPDLAGDKRAKLELEIDLRIVERSLVAMAGEAKFSSNDQVVAWLRAKQFRDAVRGVEGALNQDALANPSQKDALAQIHKLSFAAAELKPGKDLDTFSRSIAIAMANSVSATPVNSDAMTPMRPKPLSEQPAGDRPPSVAELTQEVQRLAAISIPLRQQLLALASAASTSTSAPSKGDQAKAFYDVLSESVDLARGLQSNTAVTPEARENIETQLAQGIALFSDPRTRTSGRRRIEALGQYRQTLARVDKMSLSAEQMAQLAPALAWAQANPEPGSKLMGMIEQSLQLGAQWDMMTRDVSVAPALRRPLEDLKAQFAKQRAAFIQQAPRIGGSGGNLSDLQLESAELKRLYDVTEDLLAMGASLETLNGFKLKPVGGLERKVATAANAAAMSASSSNRNDGQKYLNSVHDLASLAQRLASRTLNDLPAPVAQGWAGGKLTSFENRWKAIVSEMGMDLMSGSLELDKAKVARLQGALALGEALQSARQFEEALAKTDVLRRWVDWSVDPSALATVVSDYRDATAAAVAGFAGDSPETLDKWRRLHSRYEPLIAFILRDSAYAPQCESMPIGLAADLSRLATPLDDSHFATERFASYSIGVWNALERADQGPVAERVSLDLARRLRNDLHLPPE